MADQERLEVIHPGEGGPGAAQGYAEFVAGALTRQAGDLGRSWARRGAVAVGVPGLDDQGQAADQGPDVAPAAGIVRTLAAAAAEGRQWHEKAMRTGWAAGADAVHRGNSLNQLLKELDAGVTLVLGAADAATRQFEGHASATDGLALARRISDAASLLRLAAAGGYTRGMVDDLRKRYRTIRHDLRNPLGTITTAVALMDDESVPEATRQHPRVRAMVARNARSIEAMIATTLGDPAAQLPAIAMQTTSIRALACAVKGDLSATIDGIEVVVGSDLPTFPFDSAGLELLLKAVVIAIARASRTAGGVVIDLAELTPRQATLAVHAAVDGALRGEDIDISFARELAGRLGGRVGVHPNGHVLIDIPVVRLDAPDARAPEARDARAKASAGDAGHDLGGPGEHPDGEARSL